MKQKLRLAGGTAAVIAMALALSSCDVLCFSASPYSKALLFFRASSTTAYKPPAKTTYTLSSTRKSADASHALTFNFSGETLETYQIQLTYPKEFQFHEFTAGKTVGRYTMLHTGSSPVVFNIIAINGTRAFVDMGGNSRYDSSVDTVIAYARKPASHVFSITLPYGGDGDAAVNGGSFNGSLTFAMNEGVMSNPAKSGPSYNVTAKFTSVDLDSGGADDNKGTAPKKFIVVKKLRITE